MLSTIINAILQRRVLAHSLFWLSTLVVYPLYALGFGQQLLASFLMKLFILPVQIVATYSWIHYLIPKYLYTKRYLLFFLLLLVNALFFCTIAHLIDDYICPLFLTGYDDIHSIAYILTHPFANMGYQVSQVYLTVLLVTTIKIIKDRFEKKEEVAVLQKEKATAELKLLKAQINPRILTKSLRQLQQLAQQQSELAPEMVLVLSEMLDYMLYQCDGPQVALEKEVELLKNYLTIEQIRYGENLSIEFNTTISEKPLMIAPLLLLTILEQAFQKLPSLNHAEQVQINLISTDKQLQLSLYSTLMLSENIKYIQKQLTLLYSNQHLLERSSNQLHLTLDLCPTPLSV